MGNGKGVQTIEDIARLAKVSKATVSRALNNSSLISLETRERVRAIAREHDFAPNASARSLSLRQSRTIAFVAPASNPDFPCEEDLFGLEMLSSVGNGLRDLDYDLLVIHVDPRDTGWAHRYLDSGRVAGFIVVSARLKRSQLESMVASNAPFIGWGIPLAELTYCTVSGDNLTGGLVATRHLIHGGRQRIGFLGGPHGSPTVQSRLRGYGKALRSAGRPVDASLIVYGDYSYASGGAAMHRLVEQCPEVDAVFVNSDLMAIGAITALHDLGKRVPEEVAVVGYDDLPIARYNNLPLTTVRQNLPLAGRLLAQNLIQYIRSGVVTNVTLPVELVIRRSA